jgi:drug/metabolite transporter (DMT)-like permease
MRNRNAVPYLMLTCTSVIFGFSFLVTRGALETLGEFQMLGLRFALAAIVMTVLAAVRAVKVRISRAKLKALLPLALIQSLIYFTGETYGIRLTSASESGMMIALIPIAIALFSVAILKESLTVRQWVSIGASVGGVALIVAAHGFSGGGSALGYGLLLVAVTAEGLYCALARRVSTLCSPFELTLVTMWTGAIGFNIIGVSSAAAQGTLTSYLSAALTPGAYPGLLYLGLLSSIAAFFGVNYALSKIPASNTAAFSNLTTVVSVLAGALLGGETLYPLQIAGMTVILLSIWGIAGGKPAHPGCPQDVQTSTENP